MEVEPELDATGPRVIDDLVERRLAARMNAVAVVHVDPLGLN